jgi:ABC-2 type transport system permease protein
MRKLATAVSVEFKKFLNSKIPFLTMLAAIMIPLVGGLFMFILKDPAFARKMGIVSAKAQLAGAADWPSYLGLLAQAISLGGLMIFGFIASWVFGREYSDRTIKDLLALPTTRNTIVISKFIVILLWCLFLSLVVCLLGYFVGVFVDIPGGTTEVISQGFSLFLACSVLTMLLSTPVALFACIGRGYLSPLGFVIFTLVLAQIAAATGYGQLFPWSIPALASGAGGSGTAALEGISVIIVLATSLIGLITTMIWWRCVDQH